MFVAFCLLLLGASVSTGTAQQSATALLFSVTDVVTGTAPTTTTTVSVLDDTRLSAASFPGDKEENQPDVAVIKKTEDERPLVAVAAQSNQGGSGASAISVDNSNSNTSVAIDTTKGNHTGVKFHRGQREIRRYKRSQESVAVNAEPANIRALQASCVDGSTAQDLMGHHDESNIPAAIPVIPVVVGKPVGRQIRDRRQVMGGVGMGGMPIGGVGMGGVPMGGMGGMGSMGGFGLGGGAMGRPPIVIDQTTVEDFVVPPGGMMG